MLKTIAESVFGGLARKKIMTVSTHIEVPTYDKNTHASDLHYTA